MIKLALLLLAGCLAACDGCAKDGQDGAVETGAASDSGSLAAPVPGAVYKRARERARATIDAENAKERLEQIEREVERGAEALR